MGFWLKGGPPGPFSRPTPVAGRRLRRVASAVALVLAVQTALVVEATGQSVALTSLTPTAASAANAAEGPAEAQDEASAVLTARLQDRRIEVLSARTTDSTTYALPSGELQTEAYAGPVRVKQDGRWENIDTSLSDTGSALTPEATAADIAVSDGGDSALASVSKGGKSFGLGWQDKLPTPVVKDNTASYALGGGQKLTVSALPEGFTQNVVLSQRPDGAVSYRIPMDLDGLKLSQADSGHLLLKDTSGKLVAEASAPMMWDSATNAVSGEPDHRSRVATKIETDGDGNQTLVLSPAADFLATATYPVTVDPTSTLAVTTDTWVQTPDYPDSQVGSQELKSGTYDTGQDVARAYVKFDMSKFTGKHITSATMSLYSYYSSTCATTGPPTQAKRVTSALDTTTLTWGAQPSTTTTNMATNTGHWGYNSSCPAAYSNWTLTGMVQDWANGAANYGVQVRSADETDATTWRRFRSANYTTSGYAPKLVVNYNTKPGQPTPVSPVTGAATNDTTPTLSGKATDADGNSLYGHFEIWNTAHTTMIASGDSSTVTSGSTFSWTTTPALGQGPYDWRVLSRDGTDGSIWSAWSSLTVDTTKPSATAPSSTDFPADAWSGTPDDNGSFSGTFDFTPPASDVASVLWNLDGTGAHTLPTTGAKVSVTLTFSQGKHTLYATTHDRAGNVSALTTYVFYAGSGASLDSPSTGDRTARRITLAASSDSTEGYTGVSYQFRRGETDAWWDVPSTDVKQSDGSAVAAWPVPASQGAPAPLTWNVTDTLTQDGVLEIRAAFVKDTTKAYSQPETITLDRDAGSAPSTNVGPGSVNMLTGDFGLSAKDTSGFGLSVSRTASSRRPTAGADADGQAAIFGPEWISGVTAVGSEWSYVRETSTASVALVDADGGETGFTATSGGGWKPEPGSEDLTLTGSFTGTFTLKDKEGTTTTFAKVDTPATTWQVSATYLPTDNSTTKIVSELVTSGTKTLSRPKYMIAPTTAVASSTCQSAPSTKGCRVMEFVYAASTTATSSVFGDYKDQVKQIKLWATDPGASAATATAVAQYAYDNAGQLREEWDPRISPALKTQYTYESNSRLSTFTPAGELPWTFTYGKVGNEATAGDGMLLTASRPALAQDSAHTTSGTATTTVVYDVPLSGGSAPYQMDSNTVATWAQYEAPTDATAVFPADSVPASSTGSVLTASSYDRATITYIDADGQETNTANPGGGITTTEHDILGNNTSQLSAANRALALSSSSDELTELGLDGLATAERAQQLATVSTYSADGTRGTGTYGPLHQVTLTKDLTGSVTLPAGSVVPARTHTALTYDENRPADAAISGLLTSKVTGAAIANSATDADTSTVAYSYDWSTGQQKSATGSTTSDVVATYDNNGRVASTRTPGSSGSDADTLNYTYYSATATGVCASAEWDGLLCRTAPAAAITNGASNPSEAATTVYTYDRWGQMASKSETANGVTRTTTITIDAAGRTTKKAVTGGTGTDSPAATTTYDPSNGQPATQSSSGKTIVYRYDDLGRQISYDDGAGNTTTTSYDILDRTAGRTDSAPSTQTYAYSTAGDLKTLTDSVAGTFRGTYDADGTLTAETLPGNYALAVDTDPVGQVTDRSYTTADHTTIASDTADYTIDGRRADHTQTDGTTVQSAYTYTSAGRLSHAVDNTQAGCTARTYTFDGSSNRTALTTTSDDCDSSTSDATTVTTPYTYDTADRLVNSGYAYDAFGRTTANASTALAYYTNDLVRSETLGSSRNIWDLDGAGRLAVQTAQSKGTDGTWSTGTVTTSHYGDASDSPVWSVTGTTVARYVHDLAGSLAATTTASGGVVLQLSDVHGNVTVQQPLDTSATVTVRHYDEYGNVLADSTDGAGYDWLGAYQRSGNTLSGYTLMGARLYDPSTGRFLSQDAVYGGNSNAYEYCSGNPITCLDLTGLSKHNYNAHGWHFWGWESDMTNSRGWNVVNRFNEHAAATGILAAMIGAYAWATGVGALAAALGGIVVAYYWYLSARMQSVLYRNPKRGVKLQIVFGYPNINRE
ncbi:DNRLRE domain-containing protein [Streptomyces sp. NPDC005195]|uniref:DNRLRE domain-containing protein n=1 Tax=Streptomyces sp. NPDC005195 TaxID=3154561 RepID=UPI0033B45C3F